MAADKAGNQPVRGTARLEQRVVRAVFWISTAGLGVCGNRVLVAGNLGDHHRVLPTLKSRSDVIDALPFLGQFCVHPEFHNLEFEPGMTSGSVTVLASCKDSLP